MKTTANLGHQDDLFEIHLKFYEKMKPPSTTLRNVSQAVSSQPDIPLLAKYILSFTAAKDQTSKRLLQNDLDLTTQKRQ